MNTGGWGRPPFPLIPVAALMAKGMDGRTRLTDSSPLQRNEAKTSNETWDLHVAMATVWHRTRKRTTTNRNDVRRGPDFMPPDSHHWPGTYEIGYLLECGCFLSTSHRYGSLIAVQQRRVSYRELLLGAGARPRCALRFRKALQPPYGLYGVTFFAALEAACALSSSGSTSIWLSSLVRVVIACRLL